MRILLLVGFLVGCGLSLNLPIRFPSKSALHLKHHKTVRNVNYDMVLAPTIAIYVGSDMQFETLTIDLQHSYVWIMEKYGQDTGFNPKNSTTFQDLHQHFSDKAHNDPGLEGTISGYYAADDWRSSDLGYGVTVKGLKFALATTVYEDYEFEFAQDQWSPLNNQQLGGNNTFTFRMLPNSEYEQGSLEFGGMNKNCAQNMSVDVRALTTDWRITVDGASVGNVSYSIQKLAQWDSVSEFTGVPKDFYKGVHSLVQAYSDPNFDQPLVDCSVDKYPDITYTMNGKPFSITEEAYIFRNPEYHYCMLMLYPIESTGFHPSYSFGWHFFTNKCVQFTWDGQGTGIVSLMDATNVRMK